MDEMQMELVAEAERTADMVLDEIDNYPNAEVAALVEELVRTRLNARKTEKN